MENISVEKVWLTDSAVWIRTKDGKEACELFADFPRLRFARPEQREKFSLDGYGIHWDEINEDLSFEGFFREKKNNPLYNVFIAHPELDASAIARRLGMPQSLFAQYLCGSKKPSKEQIEEIFAMIRAVGQDLSMVAIEQ